MGSTPIVSTILPPVREAPGAVRGSAPTGIRDLGYDPVDVDAVSVGCRSGVEPLALSNAQDLLPGP